MNHHMDPHFYRVIAVAPPKFSKDLIYVSITLENMRGEQKEEKMHFTDSMVAWDFYKTQLSMLNKNKVK